MHQQPLLFGQQVQGWGSVASCALVWHLLLWLLCWVPGGRAVAVPQVLGVLMLQGSPGVHRSCWYHKPLANRLHVTPVMQHFTAPQHRCSKLARSASVLPRACMCALLLQEQDLQLQPALSMPSLDVLMQNEAALDPPVHPGTGQYMPCGSVVSILHHSRLHACPARAA
jgi:hypothetical protein